MKKKKTQSHKNHRSKSEKSYSLSGGKKLIYGLEQDFVLIAGGSFVLVIFGIMNLYLSGILK